MDMFCVLLLALSVGIANGANYGYDAELRKELNQFKELFPTAQTPYGYQKRLNEQNQKPDPISQSIDQSLDDISFPRKQFKTAYQKQLKDGRSFKANGHSETLPKKLSSRSSSRLPALPHIPLTRSRYLLPGVSKRLASQTAYIKPPYDTKANSDHDSFFFHELQNTPKLIHGEPQNHPHNFKSNERKPGSSFGNIDLLTKTALHSARFVFDSKESNSTVHSSNTSLNQQSSTSALITNTIKPLSSQNPSSQINSTKRGGIHSTRTIRGLSFGRLKTKDNFKRTSASSNDKNRPFLFEHLSPGSFLRPDPKKWGRDTATFVSRPLYRSPEPGTEGLPRWMFQLDEVMDMIEPLPGRYRAVHHKSGLIPKHLLPTYPCFLKFKKKKESCNCGLKLKRRIVGGHMAKKGEHPWIAGFFTTSNPVRFCGGTILHKSWIITAAHCFMKKRDMSTLRVGLGDFDVLTTDDYERVRNVQRVIQHPGFHPKSGHNDMALVKLSEPLQFNFAIAPACLPYQFTNCSWMNDDITVIGWGRIMEGFHHPSVLREATLKVIDTQECRKRFELVDYTNMCAHKEGTDTCQGDSGGPALMKILGRNYVVGIVSWGIGCARPNQPGIYTSVNYYLDWINDIIGEDELCHM